MATTVKEKKAPAKKEEPEEPNDISTDVQTKSDAKHTDFAVAYDLDAPFDGIETLNFRRIKLVDLKNIFGHEKATAQLIRFIQDKAEPALSNDQIRTKLDAYDADGCQAIMNWLCGGYLDEDEAEASIFDERPERGTYDKEAMRLNLGFPIYTQDSETGNTIAIRHIDFSDTVPFGRSGALQAATDWAREVQAFVRIYAKPVMVADVPLRLLDSLTDQMDATDVLQILTEVMPEVKGKSGKKRKFKRL